MTRAEVLQGYPGLRTLSKIAVVENGERPKDATRDFEDSLSRDRNLDYTYAPLPGGPSPPGVATARGFVDSLPHHG